MWWDRKRPWTVLVAPLTAGALMVFFFWLFDRWDKLENPVQSQVAIVAALAGFLTALAVQRIHNWLLVAIPGAITAAVAAWAIFMPHDTPEDNDLRQILAILAIVLAVTTLAINLPQLLRGGPDTAGKDEPADVAMTH